MASLTVNPDYKLIGNNIKQMRTKSQVSQQSLAKAINISQTHMSNLENGKTGVSLAIAIRISQHLKCSLDELIFGTNKKSYPAASKPLSDHTVDEFNQLALSGRNDVSMSAAPGSPKCKINRAAFQFYP